MTNTVLNDIILTVASVSIMVCSAVAMVVRYGRHSRRNRLLMTAYHYL